MPPLSPLQLFFDGFADKARAVFAVLKAGVDALQGAPWETGRRLLFVDLFSTHTPKIDDITNYYKPCFVDIFYLDRPMISDIIYSSERGTAMAQIKYFNGTDELTGLHGLDNTKFAAAFPGVKGRRFDSFSRLVGYTAARRLVPAERAIEYKSNPSKHVCDARCYNATGKIMKCECSCGGKNHGRGAFNCEAA